MPVRGTDSTMQSIINLTNNINILQQTRNMAYNLLLNSGR